jgi:acylglycerol lipase
MSSTTEHVAARDGTPLLLRHWAVSSGEAWATLLITHGLAEHSGRYEHVGEHFAGAGIDSWALDFRGFGRSGGLRAWIERWSLLHDDLEAQVMARRAAAPGRPIVLYGHSLGGLVTLGYVLDGRAQPDALVLTAPAIGASVPAWQRALVTILSRVAPRVTIPNRLDGSVLSYDPAVGSAYFTDPLNVHRTTVRFASLAFAEQRRVSASLDRLAIPTLVLHGADDELVPTATTESLGGRAGVIREVLAGRRHEIHNEPDPEVVLDRVIAWIRATV